MSGCDQMPDIIWAWALMGDDHGEWCISREHSGCVPFVRADLVEIYDAADVVNAKRTGREGGVWWSDDSEEGVAYVPTSCRPF